MSLLLPSMQSDSSAKLKFQCRISEGLWEQAVESEKRYDWKEALFNEERRLKCIY